MKVTTTPLPGLVILEPEIFADSRGYLLETFHASRFLQAGIETQFIQENHAHSLPGVLRGLHYQIQHPQGKLIRVVQGEVFDVAVDLRRSSPTFGRWFGTLLNDVERRQLYVPPHCAHGYCVLSLAADVVYKCTDVYAPQHERTIAWNDPDLKIDWPVTSPILSEKDRRGLPFAESPCFP